MFLVSVVSLLAFDIAVLRAFFDLGFLSLTKTCTVSMIGFQTKVNSEFITKG